MIRFLQYFNLLGIAALAALCAVQWKANSRLNLQINDLEKTRLDQLDTIARRDETIHGQAADLDEFRARLTTAESQLKDLEAKLTAATYQRDELAREKDRLVEERAKLTAALETWKTAVAARDAALKESRDTTDHLTADRNAAVVKFNELAEKYNKLVKDWNARMSATTAPATREAPAK